MVASQLHEVLLLPSNKTVRVPTGTSILQAVRRAGVSLPVRCDGKAACLMCKVHVDGSENSLSAPNVSEQRKLGSALDDGVRLGCQAKVQGNAVIILPEDRLKAAIRRQLEQENDDLSDW